MGLSKNSGGIPAYMPFHFQAISKPVAAFQTFLLGEVSGEGSISLASIKLNNANQSLLLRVTLDDVIVLFQGTGNNVHVGGMTSTDYLHNSSSGSVGVVCEGTAATTIETLIQYSAMATGSMGMTIVDCPLSFKKSCKVEVVNLYGASVTGAFVTKGRIKI